MTIIPQTLYHHTSAKGYADILTTMELRPSMQAVNPRDARHGDGQYLTDIEPGRKSPGQLAYLLLNDPRGWRRFTHFFEIEMSGLNVVAARAAVFVVPGNLNLPLHNRVMRHGQVP